MSEHKRPSSSPQSSVPKSLWAQKILLNKLSCHILWARDRRGDHDGHNRRLGNHLGGGKGVEKDRWGLASDMSNRDQILSGDLSEPDVDFASGDLSDNVQTCISWLVVPYCHMWLCHVSSPSSYSTHVTELSVIFLYVWSYSSPSIANVLQQLQ